MGDGALRLEPSPVSQSLPRRPLAQRRREPLERAAHVPPERRELALAARHARASRHLEDFLRRCIHKLQILTLGVKMPRAAGLILLALLLLLFAALACRALLRRRARRGWRTVLRALRVRTNRFKLAKKSRIRDDLLKDDEVLAAIVAHAKETGSSLAEAEARVRGYLDEIIPAFDLFTYYRVGLPIARAALGLLWKLVIWRDELPDAKRLHRANACVYVFNHRSNADYVFAAVALRDRVALAFAVGEWARVWPLEGLFKAFGSYFVRRGFKERLYHEVLRRYVQLVTVRGVPQAVFLEGGLSRDGRLREAKVGLLDHMVQCAAREEMRKDIVFVPAAINYDRVLEDRALVAEAAAKDPDIERPAAVSRWQSLRRTMQILFTGSARLALRRTRKFGYAAIRFGRPVSLRETLAKEGRGLVDLPREQRLSEVKRFGEALLARSAALMPVAAVPLAALALVHAGFSGGRLDIVARVGELRERLVAKGYRLVREDKTDAEMVDYALLLLVTRGTVVREADGLYRVPEGERGIVRYYANSIAQGAPAAASAAAEEIG